MDNEFVPLMLEATYSKVKELKAAGFQEHKILQTLQKTLDVHVSSLALLL